MAGPNFLTVTYEIWIFSAHKTVLNHRYHGLERPAELSIFLEIYLEHLIFLTLVVIVNYDIPLPAMPLLLSYANPAFFHFLFRPVPISTPQPLQLGSLTVSQSIPPLLKFLIASFLQASQDTREHIELILCLIPGSTQ